MIPFVASAKADDSALEEILMMPLFRRTFPATFFIFLALASVMKLVQIWKKWHHTDSLEAETKRYRTFFVASIFISMLLTLSKDQFELLGGAISFWLIFAHYLKSKSDKPS